MKVKKQRKRSSTVPNTPKHNKFDSSSISNKTDTSITNTSNLNNNDNIEVNNNKNGTYFWEPFPSPHFMLPTFSINCRTFKHAERCPRACKALAEASEIVSNQQRQQQNDKKQLQKTLERLAMPKNRNESATIKSDHQVSASVDSFKPKKQAIKQNNGPIKVNKVEIAQLKSNKKENETKLKTNGEKEEHKVEEQISSNKESSDECDKIQLVLTKVENEQEIVNDPVLDNSVSVVDNEIANKEFKTISSEEEIYKKKLEEKRREAREKAAKEAEIEKKRQEELERQEIERLRIEEELQRKSEEEEIRLQEIAAQQEQERLREAIKLEEERREREEMEKKIKEENERKAKEEADRLTLLMEKDRIEKSKKEEEERIERKKKVDEIMKRFHKDENTNSEINKQQSNNNNNNTALNGSIVIEPQVSIEQQSDQKYKTPLLQSILNKTSLNKIFNKYDSATNNKTLNNSNNEFSNTNGNNKMTTTTQDLRTSETILDETIDLTDETLLTSKKSQTIEPKVAFELEMENNDNIVPPQISV